MIKYQTELAKIKKNLCGVRNDDIRRKVRLMIRAMEDRNISRGCDQAGLCRKTFYDWLKKLRQADYDLSAVQNRPRGARISHRRLDAQKEQRLCEIRKELGGVGGRLASYFYFKKYGVRIAHATADRVFARYGLTVRQKPKKKNRHTRRYASANPLDRVQMDTLWLRIVDEHGNRVYVVNAVDCHSRFAFSYCSLDKGTYSADQALQSLLANMGKPEVMQTDNGVEFTFRYVSQMHPKRKKEARLSPFEDRLAQMNIKHHLIPPGTPAHNGKVERFNRTMLKYIRNCDLDGKPISLIDKHVQSFVKWYNEERPHSSQNMLTPYQAFYGVSPIRAA